jgi:HAMP domain-containing protein
LRGGSTTGSAGSTSTTPTIADRRDRQGASTWPSGRRRDFLDEIGELSAAVIRVRAQVRDPMRAAHDRPAAPVLL